jgi:AraC-like DNA-binding protein
MIEVVRGVAGEGWIPEQIELQSGGDVAKAAASFFPGARIASRRAATSISFPRAFLSRSFAARAGTAAPAAVRVGEWLSSAPPRDFAASVGVLVDSALGDGRHDLATIASAAGTSVRTLQRALTRSGTSFSEILQRKRITLAQRMLDDPALRITDVALRVGYTDASHFSRAFREWTSLAPREYRRSRDAVQNPARRSKSQNAASVPMPYEASCRA